MTLSGFALGIVGFLGFELLRIYKIMWHGKKKIAPLANTVLYCFVLVIVGLFAGCVASAFAGGNALLSLYVGFSIPTNAKAFFGGLEKQEIGSVDDIAVKSASTADRAQLIAGEYFAW